MIGKRSLVEYEQSDEDEQPETQAFFEEDDKPRKQLKYNDLLASNPIKEVNDLFNDDTKLEELRQEIKAIESKESGNSMGRREISVHSVTGNKVFSLPETNFSKTHSKRNPFYYKMMTEIYEDEIKQKIRGTSSPRKNIEDTGLESNEAELLAKGGRRINSQISVKEISQANQVSFDEKAYLEQMLAKKEKMQRTLKVSDTQFTSSSDQVLHSMASKQIEQDLAIGTPAPQKSLTKQQVGF